MRPDPLSCNLCGAPCASVIAGPVLVCADAVECQRRMLARRRSDPCPCAPFTAALVDGVLQDTARAHVGECERCQEQMRDAMQLGVLAAMANEAHAIVDCDPYQCGCLKWVSKACSICCRCPECCEAAASVSSHCDCATKAIACVHGKAFRRAAEAGAVDLDAEALAIVACGMFMTLDEARANIREIPGGNTARTYAAVVEGLRAAYQRGQADAGAKDPEKRPVVRAVVLGHGEKNDLWIRPMQPITVTAGTVIEIRAVEPRLSDLDVFRVEASAKVARGKLTDVRGADGGFVIRVLVEKPAGEPVPDEVLRAIGKQVDMVRALDGAGRGGGK